MTYIKEGRNPLRKKMKGINAKRKLHTLSRQSKFVNEQKRKQELLDKYQSANDKTFGEKVGEKLKELILPQD